MTIERKPQRANNNAVDRKAQAFVAADAPQVPRGYKLDSEEAQILWAEFTAARSAGDWMRHDLITLAKIVDLELRIRDLRDSLDETGYLVENQRGTMVQNPQVMVWQTMIHMQMTAIRALSLTSAASDKSVIRNQAKQDAEAVKVLAQKGPLSLIAGRN